jgi:hypothetical protein
LNTKKHKLYKHILQITKKKESKNKKHKSGKLLKEKSICTLKGLKREEFVGKMNGEERETKENEEMESFTLFVRKRCRFVYEGSVFLV